MATFLAASVLLWVMIAGLVVLWIIDGKIKKEQVVHAVIAMILAWIISEMIKSFFPIPRPFVLDGTTPMVFSIPLSGAFPSSHTAVAFALSVTIWLHNRSWGLVYLVMAFFV